MLEAPRRRPTARPRSRVQGAGRRARDGRAGERRRADHRGPRPRHRRLRRRAGHRGDGPARRHGRRGGPADHARVRQGDDGRPVARGGHGPRAEGVGRRQGLRGHADPHARGRGRRRRRAGRRRRRAPAAVGPGPVGRGHRRPPRRGRRARLRARAATPPRSAPPTSASKVVLDRALRAARRRLPERRLHPVQGAAARREGDRRGRGGRGARASRFGEPEIDLDGAARWKDGVVGKLTGGLDGLAKQRKVEVVRGDGRVHRRRTSSRVEGADGDDDGRVRALHHRRRLERGAPARASRRRPADHGLDRRARARRTSRSGCSSSAAASSASRWRRSTTRSARKVTVVELLDQLIPGADQDLVRPLQKRIEGRYEAIHLETKVARSRPPTTACGSTFEGDDAPEPQTFDRVLVAVGRRPNGAQIGADAAGVDVDERGFIPVDRQMRTNVPHIFAIGDIVGEPMLAHKATHEGKVAAEVIAGHDVALRRARDPVRRLHRPRGRLDGPDRDRGQGARASRYEKATFPWAASGRALALGPRRGRRPSCCSSPRRGACSAPGIVGVNAGELIAETVLALEMGADAEDIGADDPPAPDAVGDGRLRGRDGRRARSPT